MALSKEQLAEWEKREAAYYADAEYWNQLQEKMKRQQDEQIEVWKRKDQLIELSKYTQEEINEANHQIRIDKLKIILNTLNRC
jgi:hypothetical protein